MYKKIQKTKIIQTIGEYTIIKSVEQTYWDNGERFGKPILGTIFVLMAEMEIL